MSRKNLWKRNMVAGAKWLKLSTIVLAVVDARALIYNVSP
jgi:hypothetical protein